MKIFITGGTGFIGSHLIRKLIARGDSVRALIRNPEKSKELAATGAELFKGSLEDEKSLRAAVKGVDAVVHLAGLTHASKRQDFYRVNGECTGKLGEVVAEELGRSARLIYVSSLAAAGPNCDDNPVIENHTSTSVSDYGRSKFAGEEALRALGERISLTILRPPVVYGPGDKGFYIFFKLVAGGWVPLLIGSEKKLSFVYVEDFCDGVLHALDQPKAIGQLYYLSGDEIISVREALNTIGQALNKKPRLIHVPFPLAWFLGASADLTSQLTGKAYFLSRDKLAELRAKGWFCSNQKAKRELGFTPRVSLKEGIQKTADWYRANGWLR